MEALISLPADRPYVVAFLVSFLVIATAERGWQRALLWLASGTFLGWLMEFSSIHNGFPFGSYTYHKENFPDELWLGGVPLFASLSFAFLTYFGYSVACTLLSRLAWRNGDLHREAKPGLDGSLRVLLLAAGVTTWVDTVIDPVSLLGKYWFLGDLYAYDGGGVHFDVPLSNYVGWLFTSACVVFVNQQVDGWLSARGVPARGFRLPLKPLWAFGAVLGNFAFMIGVTVYLLGPADVPPSEPLGGVLASGLALSGAFTVLAIALLWRGLARNGPAVAADALPAAGYS